MANRGNYTGQMTEEVSAPFSAPMNMGPPAPVKGVGGASTNLGDVSGFVTSGYIDKKSTPFGENAKFNYPPPGMEITNQKMADIRDMPFKKVTDESYPGDGY